ncbi:lipopolysaccharide biosynthesis protein [Micromonospora sp. DT201]|uniref:YveK family protein n=1 Tax=Micromonospora sp. DT201 TaxID=3393442 RepID=UPI003CFB21F8
MATLAVLGGAGAGVLATSQPLSYRAEVQLLVTFVREQPATGQGNGPNTQEQAGSAPPNAEKLMQRRVKTYASMMNTPRLTRPVVDALQLPYTTAEMADKIVASSTVNALAIDVAVTDGDASAAAAIANELAAELQRIAERDAAPAGLGALAQVSVLKAAEAPERPVAVSWPLHATLGALGGFAIGLGIARLLGYREAGTPISADVQAAWADLKKRLPARGSLTRKAAGRRSPHSG